MLSETGPIAAFLVGLLGGVHCVGMCGGIVAMTGASLPEGRRTGMLLAYNGGRILSYALIGALFGGLGEATLGTLGLPRAQFMLAVAAGAFMILLGLYLGGWWHGLQALERLGGRLVWTRLEPLGRRFLPPRTPARALLLGMVWGWLPCGLVYSVAIWSLSAGSAPEGALLTLAFGLGTLPNLMMMGWAASRLQRWARRSVVRRIAGLVVVLMGGLMLWRALSAGFLTR